MILINNLSRINSFMRDHKEKNSVKIKEQA